MKKNDLFTIGELSKISRISVKTLRYYDQIDLLKPSFIDPENHYRYYSWNHIFTISIIKELKLFEFSISEIKELLKRDDLDRIVLLYRQKKAEIEKQLFHLENIKTRIENRFETFENYFRQKKEEELLLNYIELKEIPQRSVVFNRKTGPLTLNEMSLRCIDLHNLIEENGLYIKSPFMAIIHDPYESIDLSDADIETCGEINSSSEKKELFIHTLPGGLYASIIYRGGYEASLKAYRKLMNKINEKGYHTKGPLIKVYLLNLKLIQSEEHFVSEFQILIQK